MQGDIHQGLFITVYDYGYGNELVPYFKSQAETVLTLVCLAVIVLWAASIIIKMLQKQEVRHLWRSLAVTLMVCGFIASFFSIMLIGSPTATLLFFFVDITSGITFSVLGELMDDAHWEEVERHARFRRQRQIRAYERQLERGKRKK